MPLLAITPEAIAAASGHLNQADYRVYAAIIAFCDAEELTVEESPVLNPVNAKNESVKREYRLVGPWRSPLGAATDDLD